MRPLLLLAIPFLLVDALLLVDAATAPSFGTIRRIYDVHTLLLPLGLVAAGGWCLRDRGLRGRTGRAAIAVAVLLAGVRVWATHVEPAWLAVRGVTLPTPKVAAPVRILHITDIQSLEVGAHEERALARAAALRPDLVLFTGDLIQRPDPAAHAVQLAKLAPLLARLQPRLGFYGAPGDTDALLLGKGPAELGGMELLADRAVTIDAGGGTTLRLLGLSLRRSRTPGLRDVQQFLAAGDPASFSIVLGHAPDYIVPLADQPLDLCLAGHTHGGQVVLPLLGAPMIASAVPRAWASGFRTHGLLHLNVSAGIGVEHAGGIPPIRFNCPSEMTLIELVPVP